jgi:hypothetical protein
LFPRHFLVLDASGGTLLEANSIWSVVDRAERKAVVPALAGLTVPKIERASLPLSAIGKIVRDLPPDRETVREVRYSSLDLNQHVNNVKYAEWVCDLFEPARFCDERIKRLKINYLHEILPGKRVAIQWGEKDGRALARGADEATGEAFFEAEVLWAGAARAPQREAGAKSGQSEITAPRARGAKAPKAPAHDAKAGGRQ